MIFSMCIFLVLILGENGP